MGKCIPYLYKKADRKILDIIEAEMYKNKNGDLLPEVWQVGNAICKRFENGYYHLYLLEKDIFNGNVIRDYCISCDGKMIKTNKFYQLPTKENFFKWCSEYIEQKTLADAIEEFMSAKGEYDYPFGDRIRWLKSFNRKDNARFILSEIQNDNIGYLIDYFKDQLAKMCEEDDLIPVAEDIINYLRKISS